MESSTRPPSPSAAGPVYPGQFGPFTIEARDRREVILYRLGLGIAALSFALATAWLLGGGDPVLLTWLYAVFMAGLGLSLWTIHIYLAILHRALQILWMMGAIAAAAIALSHADPLWVTVEAQPMTILGVGLSAAALTGIFIKEAVCFNRLETKVLTVLVPLLILGHWIGWLPLAVEQGLLILWALLFGQFALRKAVQPIPPDIGDKSVFAYLKQQRLGNDSSPEFLGKLEN
jgi:uncharacterized integral membrane protein